MRILCEFILQAREAHDPVSAPLAA